MKRGDRVVVVDSRYGIEKNLIGYKGTIVKAVHRYDVDYYVNLDNYEEDMYPFFKEEVVLDKNVEDKDSINTRGF